MIVTGPPWKMARNIDAATPAQLLQTLKPADSTSRAPIVRGGWATSAKTSTSPSLELAVMKHQLGTIMLVITERCICCANWPCQGVIEKEPVTYGGCCPGSALSLLEWGSATVIFLSDKMSLMN